MAQRVCPELLSLTDDVVDGLDRRFGGGTSAAARDVFSVAGRVYPGRGAMVSLCVGGLDAAFIAEIHPADAGVAAEDHSPGPCRALGDSAAQALSRLAGNVRTAHPA
jgi:hypothetical protein